MTFNPHTDEDRKEMLKTIGISDVKDLFAPVPDKVRFPNLDLPRALTEMEAAHRMQQLAAMNVTPPASDIYMGAGSYQHYVPSTVGQILSRGELYTAYTPYQPEVAQGTLQIIYEFQSMVAELLGVDVANASMYDGATAFAEGALMTVASSKKKNRVIVAGTVHPAYRGVVHTYLDASGVVIDEIEPKNPYLLTVDDLKDHVTDDLACIAISSPNFFGAIEDVKAIADFAHEHGALLVVNTLPVPMALMKSPGELGADVVCAEGQSLGVAQSYGGPYVGLLGCSRALVRQMPGRIAGVTVDAEGKRGFVLTLQTREQHIRREKATSNICTNQGLMATAATVYMETLGTEGFREVARSCYRNAHYLESRITEIDGFERPYDAQFFHEFVVKCPTSASDVNKKLLEAGILGGVELGQFDESLADHLLICATELNNREGIDRLVEVLRA